MKIMKLKLNDVVRYKVYPIHGIDDSKYVIRKMKIVEVRMMGTPENPKEGYIGETLSGKLGQWIYDEQIVKD